MAETATESVYELPENPTYREDIPKLTQDDPVDADGVVNPLIQKILENIHAVKKKLNGFQASKGRPDGIASLDSSGKVPAAQLPDIDVSGSINTHNDDPAAHPALRTLISALDIRVALLELMYGTEVSGNPFVVTFGSLNDLTVSGVWNAPMERIEF